MDIEDITALRKHFFPKSAGETWLKSNPEGLSLSKSEFIQAMDSIAGSSILSLCAAKVNTFVVISKMYVCIGNRKSLAKVSDSAVHIDRYIPSRVSRYPLRANAR